MCGPAGEYRDRGVADDDMQSLPRWGVGHSPSMTLEPHDPVGEHRGHVQETS